MKSSLAWFALLGGAATVAPAQTVPPLTWELVGTEASEVSDEDAEGIAFRHGPTPDGSLDTLYVVNGDGVSRFVPAAEDWERICAQALCSADYMEATKEGYLLIGSETGPASDGVRSTDGGFTWEDDVIGYGVSVLLQSTLPALGGAVYAGNANSVSFSYDGGAAGTWTLGEPMGGQPAALAEVVPSASLPEGRLLGGAWNGATYSDDGGQTWAPSSLWEPGRFVAASLAFLPIAEHPYGGAAFAGVRDFGLGRPALYRSDDGGETWAEVLAIEPGDYGVEGPDWIVAQVVSSGVVFAGIRDDIGGAPPSAGPVLASADGGQTWEVVADTTNGWGGFGVHVFEVGRDGRLYAGTDRGVWRTASPLPVASEVEALAQASLQLTLHPNPSQGAASVELTMAEAVDATVAVFDVLGRRVEVLHDGPLSAGAHRLGLDAAALPAGVYVVRATAGNERVTRKLVVAR